MWVGWEVVGGVGGGFCCEVDGKVSDGLRSREGGSSLLSLLTALSRKIDSACSCVQSPDNTICRKSGVSSEAT